MRPAIVTVTSWACWRQTHCTVINNSKAGNGCLAKMPPPCSVTGGEDGCLPWGQAAFAGVPLAVAMPKAPMLCHHSAPHHEPHAEGWQQQSGSFASN